MISKENLQKIRENLRKYGACIQIEVAIVELSELIRSISNYKRKKNLNEIFDTNIKTNDEVCDIQKEICDVYIMLEQLKFIFNLKEDELNEIITFKLNKIDYE